VITSNIDPGVLRIKLFSHSLVGEATTWYETLPQQDNHWFIIRAAFLEAYGIDLIIIKNLCFLSNK
jgi:hypothetical protein